MVLGQRRGGIMARRLGLGCIVCGAGLLATGMVVLCNELNTRCKYPAVTTGTVTSGTNLLTVTRSPSNTIQSGEHSSVVVVFKLGSEEFSASSTRGEHSSIGDVVRVRYDPVDPQRNIVVYGGLNTHFWYAYALAILGALFLSFGLAVYDASTHNITTNPNIWRCLHLIDAAIFCPVNVILFPWSWYRLGLIRCEPAQSRYAGIISGEGSVYGGSHGVSVEHLVLVWSVSRFTCCLMFGIFIALHFGTVLVDVPGGSVVRSAKGRFYVVWQYYWEDHSVA